jgi:hypothetical protein
MDYLVIRPNLALARMPPLTSGYSLTSAPLFGCQLEFGDRKRLRDRNWALRVFFGTVFRSH